MCFFPREKCRILSRRTPEEIHARLLSVTDVASWEMPFLIILFFGVSGDRAFIGKVKEDRFKLIPRPRTYEYCGMTLRPKNPFFPMIMGRIQRVSRHTEVELTMRLWPPVLLFLFIWFGMAGLFFLSAILNAVTGGGIAPMIASGGFIAMGQLFVRSGFYVLAKRARQSLEALCKM